MQIPSTGSFKQVIAAATGSTIVRAVAITHTHSVGYLDLSTLLQRTNQELEEVAEQTGAATVRPRWGLYPTSERPDLEYLYYRLSDVRRTGVPKGHIVVAEVDIVRNASKITPSSECYGPITRGIGVYNKMGGERLFDVRLGNFVEETKAATASNSHGYHIDPEPRFHTRP